MKVCHMIFFTKKNSFFLQLIISDNQNLLFFFFLLFSVLTKDENQKFDARSLIKRGKKLIKITDSSLGFFL